MAERTSSGESSPASVVLRRGPVAESRHRIHVAAVDSAGRLVRCAGDPDLVTCFRSAAKPLQALPLVEDGIVERLGIPGEELALCCASHGGEPPHVAGVRRLLARAGLDEEALGCGPHPPLSEPDAEALAREGRPPGRIHNNCSGKHAGMLALAAYHGWRIDGYLEAEHPVQQRMLEEVARWTGSNRREIPLARDGCGVVTFAVPLRAMARAYAGLGAAAVRGEPGAGEVLAAMGAHSFFVGGTGRLSTLVAQATGGGVIAKGGAEGIYCAIDRRGGIGVALKVEDGARRASEVALVAVLDRLGLLPAEGVGEELAAFRHRLVPNTRGEPAAVLEPEIDLVEATAGTAGATGGS